MRGPAAANPTSTGRAARGGSSLSAKTEDGRYLITLKGLIRFVVERELSLRDGYRRVRARFGAFRDDLMEPPAQIPLDRDRLLNALRAYLRQQSVEAKLGGDRGHRGFPARGFPGDDVSPSAPARSRRCWRRPVPAERAEIVVTLLEMALLERSDDEGRIKQ